MMPHQPFHLVQLSYWPLAGSLGAMLLTYSLASWFHLSITWFDLDLTFAVESEWLVDIQYSFMLPISIIIILATMIFWWRDVLRESTICGAHTLKVQRGLEWGMILFITSEVMFFSAFFWAFFHSSLAPTLELGCLWPPSGTWPLNPFGVPLLNTAVLLASGVTVTWAHHGLLTSYKCELVVGLILTVMLGVYFTYLQMTEYMDTSFGFNDSVYGSSFFIATGFHGFHVMIGSTFLLVCLQRAQKNQFSKDHHFGLEAAAWYWHFVDVVWIFLFLSMYWWGSN